MRGTSLAESPPINEPLGSQGEAANEVVFRSTDGQVKAARIAARPDDVRICVDSGPGGNRRPDDLGTARNQHYFGYRESCQLHLRRRSSAATANLTVRGVR